MWAYFKILGKNMPVWGGAGNDCRTDFALDLDVFRWSVGSAID